MSRAAVLLLALLCMNVLLGVVVLVVARGERDSKALRLWGWGLLTYAASMLLFVARDVPLWGLRPVVGNALIALSALLTALGVYRHTTLRISPLLLVGGLAATVLAVAVGHGFGFTVMIDIAAPTIYATALYAPAAAALIWRPPAAARAAAWFLAASILVVVLMWNVRLAAIWQSLGGTQDTERADLMVSLFAIAQILTVVSCTLGLIWIEVRLMQSELKQVAFSDLLTGVPNRRAMRERFREELARSKRLGQKFGVALFDIDHFKQINDRFGHFVGDRVLRQVVDAMKHSKRTEDVLGRIGGEEFLVILPHHDHAASITAAERLRRAVTESKAGTGEQSSAVTVSAGVAVFPDDGDDWDQLFTAADRRLYRAKRAGRNQVAGRVD